jgi:hypothetical protein
MERFNLKKLDKVDGKEQCCVEVPKRFAALKDLAAEMDINSTLETITENTKISANKNLCYYELLKHKPWFDERCSELLDKRNKLNCSGYRI